MDCKLINVGLSCHPSSGRTLLTHLISGEVSCFERLTGSDQVAVGIRLSFATSPMMVQDKFHSVSESSSRKWEQRALPCR